MTIAQQLQASYSAGMYRVKTRDNIPANGAYDLENCLLDDAGQAPKRGGTTYLSGAGFGAGLTFLWDGEIAGGRRTLVASESAFGLLAGDDATIASLGGAGMRKPGRGALVKDKLVLPGGVTFNGVALGTAAVAADVYAAAGGRLVACIDNQAFMSARDDPSKFDPTDFHRLPNGVRIIGAEGTRDRLALFTTAGVWLVSNIELDLTDDAGNAQQHLDVFSRDMVLWGDAGLAGWQGGLVVPALDGVWLMSVGQDPASGPPPFERVSLPIADLYGAYVRFGFRPGQATVFRSHYFLPILNGPSVVDLLVCRLDRVIDKQGSRAWTRFSGHGAQLSALTTRIARGVQQPVLIGAQRDSTARVSRLAYFDNAVSTDADGSVPRWQVITRDFQASPAQTKRLVKSLRAEYQLEDPAATNPVLDVAYATEAPTMSATSTWGSSTWGATTWAENQEGFVALAGSAPEDPTGAAPFRWDVNKRAERIRFRVRCTQAVAAAALRSLELFIRPTGRP